MIRSLIPLVAMAAFVATPVHAQQAPSISLEEALVRFADGNLELAVARLRAAEAEGIARQAGAWPNPSLNATHEPLSGSAGSYSETYLTASQLIELGGARGARSEAGGRGAEAALQQLHADSSRLAFEVKRAFVHALLAQERSDIGERIAGVFREAARSAEERYGEGDLSLYALRRIDVERARYESVVADAEMEVGSAQRALGLLVAPSGEINRFVAEALASSVPPNPPAGRLDPSRADQRPELARVRAESEAEGARARLARAARVPDVIATGGFKRQSDGLRGAHVGLSFPLPVFDLGAGAVQAADARLRAAEERVTLTQRQLENDIQRTIESYETLRRRYELLGGRGASDANDLLEIALVAYGEGEMELVELLDAAEALYESETTEAGLRASLWVAYFDLERALGGFGSAEAEEDSR